MLPGDPTHGGVERRRTGPYIHRYIIYYIYIYIQPRGGGLGCGSNVNVTCGSFGERDKVTIETPGLG